MKNDQNTFISLSLVNLQFFFINKNYRSFMLIMKIGYHLVGPSCFPTCWSSAYNYQRHLLMGFRDYVSQNLKKIETLEMT